MALDSPVTILKGTLPRAPTSVGEREEVVVMCAQPASRMRPRREKGALRTVHYSLISLKTSVGRFLSSEATG